MTRAMIVVIWLAGALVAAACTSAPPPPPPASAAGAQPTPSPTPAGPPREDVMKAARTIIEKALFATMVTVDAEGAPQSRIVDPFPPEGEFTMWIATTGASRKVAEIQRDPRVALTYFDPSAPGYVTLIGNAAIVRDPAEKAKRWKEAWVGFYKDRNRGDDYTLIRVTPTRLEISSRNQGMNNDPVTWKPVTLTLK